MRQAFVRRELRQEQLLNGTLVRQMVGVATVVLAGLVQSACTTASEELSTLEESTSKEATSKEATSKEASTSALQPDSPQSTSEPTMSEPNESASTPVDFVTLEADGEPELPEPNESATTLDDLGTVEADSEPEPNESATTTPSTTAPVATTTSETTTALERHEQAPHLFDLPGSDLVIVRAGPGASTEQVTQIQAPRYAIEGTGSVETDEFGTVWRELHMFAGHGYLSTGWIEADRLKISERTQVSFFDKPCAEAGISEGAVPVNGLTGDATASSTPSGAADHIAQMWQLPGPGCDRLHVALGTDWDYGRGGELASEAPGGVTAEAFGSWVRITVPELEGARFDADLDDTWNLTALAARTAQGEFAINVYTPTCDFMRQMALSGPCVDHEITIDVYAPAPSEFAVRALSDPARLLIDVIPTEDISDAATAAVPKLFANCGTNAETVAVPKLFVDCSTIVPLDTPGDGSPIEVTLPWTVRGYAHGWFEFQGNVELYFADGSRAFGSIKGDGVVRPGISTGWGVRGGGYWSWGHFEFTIEAVALQPEGTPNQYNLWVGWYQPIDDDIFSGVTIPFRLTD